MTVRVGSVVVDVPPSCNISISLSHQGARGVHMAIERADIGDLRQALATATAAPHGGRSSDDTFNRFVRTGGAVTVVAAEQLYVRLGDSNGQPRIWLVDPLSPSGEGTWLGVANAPREARELARQLLLAADELERRRFEP